MYYILSPKAENENKKYEQGSQRLSIQEKTIDFVLYKKNDTDEKETYD